jgi:hypothetical protein
MDPLLTLKSRLARGWEPSIRLPAPRPFTVVRDNDVNPRVRSLAYELAFADSP